MELIRYIASKIEKAPLIVNPIDHIVIDNFLPPEVAIALSKEFGEYDGENWHKYSNTIEEKKTCNQWNLFKDTTYQYFQAACSAPVSLAISKKFGINVDADYGLHGGGQHIHSKMGNLNPHLDYSLHPKIKLERRLNAIYYLTDDYEKSDGGHFGLWENSSSEGPGNLVTEYEPLFNRLVLFNTSQNSWHGLSRVYDPKENRYRKSLATYYLSEPRAEALTHTRALFAPRDDQKSDEKVLRQIKDRVSEGKHQTSYVTKK